MTTTAIIVEFLVIGFFTTIWLGLILLRSRAEITLTVDESSSVAMWSRCKRSVHVISARHLNIPLNPDFIVKSKDFIEKAPLFCLPFAMMFMYQMGFLMNYLCEGLILENIVRGGILRRLNAPCEYENLRATVYQRGDNLTIDDVRYDRGVLRLLRSGVFNFSATAIVLYSCYGPRYSVFALVLIYK